MKALAAGAVLAVSLIVSGCGGDNNTTFVLSSGTPPASSSASGSASLPATGTSTPTAPAGQSATPIPNGYRIIIDSPDGTSPISSPVEVSGTASVDNGTVVAVVLDASGNELGRGTATASASKPDFGHYDVTVSFSGATSGAKGQIKVYGVDPRDGSTQTYWYQISIRFA